MTATTKAFNQGGLEGGKNNHFMAPPGCFAATLTAAAGVKYQEFLNYTQYVHIENTGAGVLRIGYNNVAGKGINGATSKTQCYYPIPAGSVFAAPLQVSKIYFKAETDTTFSFHCTFSEQKADGSELTGADQFDLVEEMDAARTNF